MIPVFARMTFSVSVTLRITTLKSPSLTWLLCDNPSCKGSSSVSILCIPSFKAFSKSGVPQAANALSSFITGCSHSKWGQNELTWRGVPAIGSDPIYFLLEIIQSDRHNVCCTRALLALSGFVFYFLAITERCVARGFDFRMVYEQILSTIIWSDKTETFVCAEPLYCTCTHTVLFLVRLIVVLSLNSAFLYRTQ